MEQPSTRPYPPAQGTATEADLSFLAPPQGPGEIGRWGEFAILKLLGSGGMGVVLLAKESPAEDAVALKVLKPELAVDATARQRFLSETRVTASIHHEHIVAVQRVGENAGLPYLVMPFLEGETLDDCLKREGRLPIPEVLRIGREIAAGLGAAHERSLIHRDIKPANIWLEAKSGRVKILDFGLARQVDSDENLTSAGAVAGTPAFMAPELVDGGQADPRSDFFSLGCLLYRACTGVPPYAGDSVMAILVAMSEGPPVPPHLHRRAVPRSLSRLVMQLLAHEPAARLQTAGAVIAALRRTEAEGRTARWRLPAAALMLAVLAGGAVAWHLNRGPGDVATVPSESLAAAPTRRTPVLAAPLDKTALRKAVQSINQKGGNQERIKLNNEEELIELYSEAIRIAPGDAELHFSRSMCYQNLKRYDEAIADLTEVLRLTPGDRKAISYRAAAYESIKDWPRALADRESLAAGNPKQLAVTRMNFYARNGFYAQAMAEADRVLELDPKDNQARRMKPDLWSEQGMWDKAAEGYLQIAPPSNGTFWILHAGALLLAGDAAAYRKVCMEMAQKNGNKPLHGPLLQLLLLAPNDVRKPLELRQQAEEWVRMRIHVSNAPANAQLSVQLTQYLALALYREGDYERAVRQMQDALALNPGPGLADRMFVGELVIAMAYDQLGQKEKARERLASAEARYKRWRSPRLMEPDWIIFLCLRREIAAP